MAADNAGPSSTQNGGGAENELASKLQNLSTHDEGESDDSGDEDVNNAGPADSGAAKKKKKNKKKKKGKGKSTETAGDANPQQDMVDLIRNNMPIEQKANVSDEQIKQALKATDFLKLLESQLGMEGQAKAVADHKFWKTQPVLQSEGDEVKEGPIETKTVDEVKKEPGALPAGFEWSIIDVKNDAQITEVHELLTDHYVEDDVAMFRFRYSKEFLLWALTPPGYFKEWHIGVRVQKTGKLIAFISGIPVELRVRENTFLNAEINFLCVHKKLRSKRLAPVLIKEVTRQVNLTNTWQAIYTAGVRIPTPFSTCRYYHRNLNPPKLVDIGFSPIPRGSSVARMVRQCAVPAEPSTPGFREMTAADVPQVAALLRRYLARFEIFQTFSHDDEVAHWFLSGMGRDVGGKRVEQVVWTYVVEDPVTHEITDMMSFYSLPSTVMQHPKHDVLNAAYMYYYATDCVFSAGASADAGDHDARAQAKLAERLNALVQDLLTMAKKEGFDVMNTLTLMDNNLFLQDQRFGGGDGYLNYYLYNYTTAAIDGGASGTATRQTSGIGVVML